MAHSNVIYKKLKHLKTCEVNHCLKSLVQISGLPWGNDQALVKGNQEFHSERIIRNRVISV